MDCNGSCAGHCYAACANSCSSSSPFIRRIVMCVQEELANKSGEANKSNIDTNTDVEKVHNNEV